MNHERPKGKKISIPKIASQVKITDWVLENFSQLQAAGGFDLLWVEL